jgi:hypothetical protein
MSTFIVIVGHEYEGYWPEDRMPSYATREEAEAAIPKRKGAGVYYEVFEVLAPNET